MTGDTQDWGADDVIVGLCAFTHDSSVALVAGGTLVGFVEEERLSGDKHTGRFPDEGLRWALSQAGLSAPDVTRVAYNFAGRRHLAALAGLPRQLVGAPTRRRAIPRARSYVHVHRRWRERMADLSARFPNAQVVAHDHHVAHGLYAFASSGYERAAVLVVDSLGELCTTSIAEARCEHDGGIAIERRSSIDDPASLGYAYGAVTEHLGWTRGDEEGTVMALAALGDPARFRSVLQQAIAFTPTGFRLDPRLLALRVLSHGHQRTEPAFAGATCPARAPGDPIEQVHADLAAALQERTEQVILHLALLARRQTAAGLLCLAGGVAANCVAVGRVIDAGLFDEVHVPPAPGDSGTAIGAALASYAQVTGHLPGGVHGRCHLGPSYEGIELPAHPRLGLAAHRPADVVATAVDALVRGEIIGLFHGPVEAGPRALGNRSILASPLEPGVVERLNRVVKHREPFRPFAPVVLADKAPDYFRLRQPSPYMSVAAQATDLAHNRVPAVIHANGTARVQTLTADQNPLLADILGEFARRTGVPVLINTSLNVRGRPICGTPDMALDCLTVSGLDALHLEGWWVRRC